MLTFAQASLTNAATSHAIKVGNGVAEAVSITSSVPIVRFLLTNVTTGCPGHQKGCCCSKRLLRAETALREQAGEEKEERHGGECTLSCHIRPLRRPLAPRARHKRAGWRRAAFGHGAIPHSPLSPLGTLKGLECSNRGKSLRTLSIFIRILLGHRLME